MESATLLYCYPFDFNYKLHDHSYYSPHGYYIIDTDRKYITVKEYYALNYFHKIIWIHVLSDIDIKLANNITKRYPLINLFNDYEDSINKELHDKFEYLKNEAIIMYKRVHDLHIKRKYLFIPEFKI